MKFPLILILILQIGTAWSSTQSLENVINNEKLNLSKSDHIIAEHVMRMIAFARKGYINQEILKKIIREVEKSKHFTIFLPWLHEIGSISKLTSTTELISHCSTYSVRKQSLPMERALEKIAGNYCRERSLEAIGREIEKTQTLSDASTIFIQQNLKSFISKGNKKNFSFFIRSQSSRPEILKKLSHEVTVYSVQHDIVPSHDVLKDIVINEQITKLIQDKGFNPLKHKNVFYAEYGKLIEQSYKTLDNKPSEDKVKEHYRFLKNYLELNADHLPVGLCLTRMNDFAKAVFRGGHEELSRDIFKYIIKKNNKEIHEDALFFHLWTYLFKNDFKESLKLADQYGLIKHNKKIIDPRLKFWLAYAMERTSNPEGAIKIYEDIITSHSLSYYGIMSSKKLQLLKPDSAIAPHYFANTLPGSSLINIELKDIDDDYISSLVRLKAWAKMDSSRMMAMELKRLKNYSMPTFLVKMPSEKQLHVKSDLHLLNARIIQNSQNYLSSFKYLYQSLESKEVLFNRKLLEVLYPKPYIEVLSKALKKEGLDPIIVLSLIRQESVFNPRAQSRVGARGLMQLMPATARRFKRSVRERQLTNPELNIELGTKYFKNLMKRYDGNLVFVLAAYNAGESRVERWKTSYFNEDETIIKNIEAIPFLETRNYVKLIFRNIFFYKLLIENNEQMADSKEVNKIFDVKLGFNN